MEIALNKTENYILNVIARNEAISTRSAAY